ncbi:hypothetical protein [Methylobacterium sp. Leaf91]|nr:hypothetical protein [Methylobacterium sp. Leaf91]
MNDDHRPIWPPAPRKASQPLPPVRYPENPSPWARLGRAIWAYLSRRR